MYAVVYTLTTTVITDDGKDYKITVTYGDDAEIPEGAILQAKEIRKGSKEYDSYLSEAINKLGVEEKEMTEESPWSTEVSFARFFDISILVDEKEIEPAAPVSVEIAYIGKENSHLGAMSIVHFADAGTEVIDATTSQGDTQTTVSFTQSSFSVTGTIINSANLGPDDYYILKESNGRWYALASDGSTVDVTDYYDPSSSSVVNYDGNKNIVWEVTYGPWDGEKDGGNGWYYIKAKDEEKYFNLNNGLITGQKEQLFIQGTTWANDQGLWVNYWSEQEGGIFVRYKDHYHHMLSWNNDHFSYTKYQTQREYPAFVEYYGDQYPTEVRFAKVTQNSDVIPGDYPNNTYNEALIQQWLDQAMTDKPLQDVTKKASIYDYDNRIYQIDFSARSGVMAMEQDISLAFVTDVSNSMLFPSKLTEIAGKKNIEMKSGNLDSLPHSNGEVYFTIGDKSGTSTVYALYYDNGWKALDASYYARWKGKGIAPDSNHQPKSIGSGHTPIHREDNASTTYTIYTANSEFFDGLNSHNIYNMSQGNMGNRLYYLESSVANATDDMRKIAKEYPLGSVYVGLETFAGKNDNDSVKFRQNYLKIGGVTNNMSAANTTYYNNYMTLYNALKNIEGQDGTRQDVALKDATFFGSNPGTGGYIGANPAEKKYVVLITDGAPNPASHKQDVIDAANKLKQNGINVITIGLSIEDVDVAPEMLYKSASGVNTTNPSANSNEPRLFYWAKSGDDLTWILRDIVRTVMGHATVTGTVTDTIDPLFYPVDKNGNPFPENAVSYIKKDGNSCNANDPEMVGKVEYRNGEWTVTWENQDMPWEGWNSSVFVKAKEDFLGGNSTSTNKESKVTPISYTTNKGESNQKTANFADILSPSELEKRVVKPSTPYVNVDELKMTSNSTTFTVYLGEEVTPSEEIRKLWNSIVVNTVVDKDGMNSDYTIKSKNDMYYDPNRPNKITQDNNPLNANKDPVTEIPLNHYIDNADELISQLISQIKDGKTQSTVTSTPIDYAPYGQGKIGTITVTLSKKVNDEAKADAPDQHETQKVLNPAETYTLTVTYTPLTGAERKTNLISEGKIDASDEGYMRSGDNGPGKEVNLTDDEVKSVNTHKIIVFAKGIQITKKDEAFNNVLTGAKFELYRTARQGESGQKSLDGVSGSYVKVADLDTSSNGVAVLNPVKGLKAGEKYYLVETQAPDGYNMIDHPVEVILDVEDHYYPAGSTEQYMREHEGTTAPEANLYNWMQKAKLTIADDSFVRRTNNDGTIDMTHEGLDYDSSNSPLMYYSISNNPGVVLPHTGGIGTTVFYIFGSILVLVSGTVLVGRRRAEHSQHKKAS